MQKRAAFSLLVAILSTISGTVTQAEFLAPGAFRELAVREVSVAQACDEEFACRSASFSRSTCIQNGVCSQTQDCHGREDFPALEHPLKDWQEAQVGAGVTKCPVVTGQPQSPPPVTFPALDGRTLIVNGSAESEPCYAQRSEPLNASFSLVFWLRADCRNCSVLEILKGGNESIHLQIHENSLCIDNRCAAILSQGQWMLVTVQVANNRMSIFGGTNKITFPGTSLDDVVIRDLYIGSPEIILETDIFELFDVRYYNDALTSWEVTYLTTGMSDPTLDFANCRCPSSHPDFDASDSSLCTDGTSTTPRFNISVHYNPPEVMLDGDANRRWASSDAGIVTLALDLGRPFEIESIKVMFESSLPSRFDVTFVYGGQDKPTRTFACTGSECSIVLAPLDASDSAVEYASRTAETIKLSMHRADRSNLGSFVVSNIVLSGRCDCNGNANTCTYDHTGNYACSCEAGTNTRGSACGTCKLNFFRSPREFGCPNACACDLAGVTNVNDMCEQMTGLCKCKTNVEGATCDKCKHFTYNLVKSNPQGCATCNCEANGTLSCSNTTGACVCRQYTGSDQCDRCTVDSYGYDLPGGCRPCACNTDGTISGSVGCDDLGQCSCKANVVGTVCDNCKPGFFNLDASDPLGCSACVCHPVGAEHVTCDTQTGRCQCRDGESTDHACAPIIASIDPDYGPQIGGTLVTITGKLLGNGSHIPSVFLEDVAQQLITVNDDAIVFKTMKHRINFEKSPTLKLQWAGVRDALTSPLTFKYLPDPVVDTSTRTGIISYMRGGCYVEVRGSNLQNVKHPRLEVTNSAAPNRAVYGECNHRGDFLLCVTPGLSTIRASTGRNDYQLKVLLDGLSSPRDLHVLANPKIDQAGNIKFQYPFEDTVELSGSSLKSSCPVTVYIGVVSCEIKHLSDTGIEFAPPHSPPSGQKKLDIEVHIGEIKVVVGTLQYLELYETTGFIIIVSCIAAAIIIVVLAVVICCCCKIRRNRGPPPAKLVNGTDGKQMVEVDARPMNNYSEFTTLVDTHDASATTNGYSNSIVNSNNNNNNNMVRMETVIREHKRGIVNSEAEDQILVEEFLPRLEPGIREDVRRCYVGNGHFVPGRTCLLRGQHTQLVDGTLQKDGTPVQKLTIKSVTDSLSGHEMPTWVNLALSECLRLRKFKHTHVLNIVGIGANQQQLHILYPRMGQGVLKALISDTNKDFSVRQLLGFSQQVAEGIDFLSSKDFTHKDVAARNCMVDEYSVVKLSDASFSWDFYPHEYVYDQSRERYLPIRWMAPESLQDGYYDMRTDVWSFAVLVWELLTRGCLPFHEVTDSASVSEYILQGYILGRPDTLSVEVYELLRSCWSTENESRPSIASVARTLSQILETEDDDVYENADDMGSFQHQHSSGMAASPRHFSGETGNFYSTTNLSRV